MIGRRPADRATDRFGAGGRRALAAGRRAALAAALLLTACFSLDRAQRRVQLDALLDEPAIPLVVDTSALLRLVSVDDSLRFEPGFEAGERLRAEFDLPSPTPGFAAAFVAALRAMPRFASARFEVFEGGAATAALRERGTSPVLFAHAGEWKLYYDLSLRRYVMSLWVSVQVAPADRVAAGSGAMALPDRLWSGDCTFRGPDPAQPLEAWRADRGALLHRVLAEAQQRCGRHVADLLARFLEGGHEQGAFDFGDLPKEPGRR